MAKVHSTTRQERGKQLFEQGNVLELPSMGSWSVLGDSHKVYLVRFRYADEMEPALFECDCVDYLRGGNQVTCKHGWAVEYHREAEAAAIRAMYSLPPLRDVAA